MLLYEKIGVGILILLVLYIYVRCASVKVYRFYTTTCPACIASQPEWDKFCGDARFKMIRPIQINMAKPDNAAFAENFKITSVPTVIKINPDGSSETYTGERKAVAYMQWVKNNK